MRETPTSQFGLWRRSMSPAFGFFFARVSAYVLALAQRRVRPLACPWACAFARGWALALVGVFFLSRTCAFAGEASGASPAAAGQFAAGGIEVSAGVGGAKLAAEEGEEEEGEEEEGEGEGEGEEETPPERTHTVTITYSPAEAGASVTNTPPSSFTESVLTETFGKEFDFFFRTDGEFTPVAVVVGGVTIMPEVGRVPGRCRINAGNIQTNMAEISVEVICMRTDTWMTDTHRRAAGTLAAPAFPANANAFAHGGDVFLAKGSSGKVTVSAQWALVALTNAVAHQVAAPRTAGYDVSVTGLPSGLESAPIANLAANTAGTALYCTAGGKVVRLTPGYDGDGRLASLAYAASWEVSADSVEALAAATVGGVDVVYGCLRRDESAMGTVVPYYRLDALNTTSGAWTSILSEDAGGFRVLALAVGGAADGAPHLAAIVPVGETDAMLNAFPLTADGTGLLVANQQLVNASDSLSGLLGAAADLTRAALVVTDDGKTALTFSGVPAAADAGTLAVGVFEHRPAEITVRAALPQLGITNDYTVAYGVAGQIDIPAPAGYGFLAATNGAGEVTLTGSDIHTWAKTATEHELIDFYPAYVSQLEVIGPADAVEVLLPDLVTIGGTMDFSVTPVDPDYLLAQVAVDGVVVTGTEAEFGDMMTYVGQARTGAKVTVALRARNSALVGDEPPIATDCFRADGVAVDSCGALAYDAANGRLAFGLSATATGAGLAEFSAAALLDAVATEPVRPVWSEVAAKADGEAWGKSAAALAKYGAYVSCNAVAAGGLWVNPSGGAWTAGGETPDSSYRVEFTDLPAEAAGLKLGVVAANAAGDALYGADATHLYRFTVVDDAGTPAKITGFAFDRRWALAAEPGALAVATIAGRDVVYAAPAADGDLQAVAADGDAATALGISGIFDTLAASGVAAGMPHLAAVKGTVANYYALYADGLSVLGATPIATRDFGALLGAESAPARIHYAADDAETAVFLGCADGGKLRVATARRRGSSVTVRARFFAPSGAEVGMASNIAASATHDFTAAFAAPAGYAINAVKANGVQMEPFATPAAVWECFVGTIDAPRYYELQLVDLLPVRLGVMSDYLGAMAESPTVIRGRAGVVVFALKTEELPEGVEVKAFVNGEPASVIHHAKAGEDDVETWSVEIPASEDPPQIMLYTYLPRTAPEDVWYNYTSAYAKWNDVAFGGVAPQGWSADADGLYFADLAPDAAAGGVRLYRMSSAEGGFGPDDAIWSVGGEMRGSAISLPLGVALVGRSDGAALVALPLAASGDPVLSGRVITAVDGGGAAAALPEVFAFSEGGRLLHGAGAALAGVATYEVENLLAADGANLVLRRVVDLPGGQSALSMAYGTLGTTPFAFAIGATDLKIYAVNLDAGTAVDTGLSAATARDALALTLKGTATPHLTVFRAGAGGGDPALLVYELAPATGAAASEEPIRSFTGAQLGALAGKGSTSVEGGRALVIPDDEAHAILGCAWTDTSTGQGDASAMRRIVLGAIKAFTVRYSCVNGGKYEGVEMAEDVDEDGNPIQYVSAVLYSASGDEHFNEVAGTLDFVGAEAGMYPRTLLANGRTPTFEKGVVPEAPAHALWRVHFDYSMADSGFIDLVAEFKHPQAFFSTLGPVVHSVSENDPTVHLFTVERGAEIASVTLDGAPQAVTPYYVLVVDESDDEGNPIRQHYEYGGVRYSAAGLEEDVRVVVTARYTNELAAADAWWGNPKPLAASGSAGKAFHFAADGGTFAYTTAAGEGRIYSTRAVAAANGASPLRTLPAADFPNLAGAGVCERLNVALFGSDDPATPSRAASIAPVDNLEHEVFEISNDCGLALDQFAFSADALHVYAHSPAGGEAADRRRIHRFAVLDGLVGDGEKLRIDAAFDFGGELAAFCLATNDAGHEILYALRADAQVWACDATSGGAAAQLITLPAAGDGDLEGSVSITRAVGGAAHLTVFWTRGGQPRLDVFKLAADGVTPPAESDRAAFFGADDFPFLSVDAAAGGLGVWATPNGAQAVLAAGGELHAFGYVAPYSVDFTVVGGRAYTNGVALAESPYRVSYRSPCEVIDFRGDTELHYLSAVSTNGVDFSFRDVTAGHPQSWTYLCPGADATVRVQFTEAVTPTFDLVGGSDLARVVPVPESMTGPYRPGDEVTFKVVDVKEGYRLAGIAADGQTVECDLDTGVFSWSVVDHGAFVLAFARADAWWMQPAVRTTITNAVLRRSSLPTALGYDPASGDLAFGRGVDSGHPGLSRYAGAELKSTVDPAFRPSHALETRIDSDVAECEPYAAVCAAAGVAVGSPASAGGKLPVFALGAAAWPESCMLAPLSGTTEENNLFKGVTAVAFGEQFPSGRAIPYLYGWNPETKQVLRYEIANPSLGSYVAVPSGAAQTMEYGDGFTCRCIGGRDVIFAAGPTKVYTLDFETGERTESDYAFDDLKQTKEGLLGLQVTGVAEGMPHLMMLHKSWSEKEVVATGDNLKDEDGNEIMVDDPDAPGSWIPVPELATNVHQYGGLSVFSLSNDCRTLLGTKPVFNPYASGLNFLPGSTWGLFAASDDETRAYNLTASNGVVRLETVEHAQTEYFVEGHFVDPLGRTVRRDRSNVFASGATSVTADFVPDDRYEITSVRVDGETVPEDAFTAEGYTYSSGMDEDGVDKVLTGYVYVRLVERFKPFVRQELLGQVTSSVEADEFVSAGDDFTPTYTPDPGWFIRSIVTNGVFVALDEVTNSAGVAHLEFLAVGVDLDVIVCAERSRPAPAKFWWENPVATGVTAQGAARVVGEGTGVASLDGGYAAFPLGVDGQRGQMNYAAFALDALEAGAATPLRRPAAGALPLDFRGVAVHAPFNLVLGFSRDSAEALALPIAEAPRFELEDGRFPNAYSISNSLSAGFDAAAFSEDGSSLWAATWTKSGSGGFTCAQRIVKFMVKGALKQNGVGLSELEHWQVNCVPTAIATAKIPPAGGGVARDVVYFITTDGDVKVIDSSVSGMVNTLASGLVGAGGAVGRIAVSAAANGGVQLVAAATGGAGMHLVVLRLAAGGTSVAETVADFDAAELGRMGFDPPPTASSFSLAATPDGGTLLHAAANGTVRAFRYAEPYEVAWSVLNGEFDLVPGTSGGVRRQHSWESPDWTFRTSDPSQFLLAFVTTNGVRMASGVPSGSETYVHTVAQTLHTLDVQFRPSLWFTNENYVVAGGETIGVITNFTTGWVKPGERIHGEVKPVREGWSLVRLELGGEEVEVASDGTFEHEVVDRNDVLAFFAPARAWWRDPFVRNVVTNPLAAANALIAPPAALDEKVGGVYVQAHGAARGLTAWNLQALTNAVDPFVASWRSTTALAPGLGADYSAETVAIRPGEWAVENTAASLSDGGGLAAAVYPIKESSIWPYGCTYVAPGGTPGQADRFSRADYGAEGGLYGRADDGRLHRYDVNASAKAYSVRDDGVEFPLEFAVGSFGGHDVVFALVTTNLVALDYAAGTATTNALCLASPMGVQLCGLAVLGANTPSPRAAVAYSTFADGYRVAVFPLAADGRSALTGRPFADFPLLVAGGAAGGRLLGLEDETRALVSAAANRTAVVEFRPDTLFVETCTVAANGSVLVAPDRTCAVAYGAAAEVRMEAPEGTLFTEILVNGAPDPAFRTSSNYTFRAESLDRYVRLTATAKGAWTVRQHFTGPVLAEPEWAESRVADGEHYVATYTPLAGYEVTSVFTNGVRAAFTAGADGKVRFDTGALFGGVEVQVTASRKRPAAANRWWENPVVVRAHRPALKASGVYHMAGDGDFVAGGGAPGEPASVLNVATAWDDNGGFTVVTNVPGSDTRKKWGAGVSAGLNRAVFGAEGEQMLVLPLAGGDGEAWTVGDGEGGRGYFQFAFSRHADVAYAPRYAAAAKPANYAYKLNVRGGLGETNGQFSLGGSVGFGQSVWGVAYAVVNGEELLYAVLDDGSVAVRNLTAGGDAATVLAAGRTRLNPRDASLCVCGAASGAPVLVLAEAAAGTSALEVFALVAGGTGAPAVDPVLSLDAEHLAAMGIEGTETTTAASAWGLPGDGQAVLGWAGDFYAVAYAKPPEVTFAVTNGVCDREAGTFRVYSYMTDGEKTFAFMADEGNILKRVTVNGRPVSFEYGASAYAYLPGGDATQHVEVVFLPPACIPEPVGTTYEGTDEEDGAQLFALPAAPGTTVTVYTNGVPLVEGTDYGIEEGRVRVPSFGELTADIHLVVAATEPREPPEKRWYEAPAAFATYSACQIPGYLGDEAEQNVTGANWGMAPTQDYLLDVAGAGHGGATLFRYGPLENKNFSNVWQIRYDDMVFGGGPLSAGAVCKPLNVALVGTSNGEYMVSLPLAPSGALDNSICFRITAVAEDGTTPTNCPSVFAFSSDGRRLYGVNPAYTGVNEYEVLGGLKSAGPRLRLVANHYFRDARNNARSGVLFAYAEIPDDFMPSQTNRICFVADATNAVYRVGLSSGAGAAYAQMDFKVWRQNDQLAVAGVGAGTPHLYHFASPNYTLSGGDRLRIYNIGLPSEGYPLVLEAAFNFEKMAELAGWSKGGLEKDLFCAMAVPDDEASFVFAANRKNDPMHQMRYLVRTVPDWTLSWQVNGGICSLGSAYNPDYTVKSGTVEPRFTCTTDFYLANVTIDGVPQEVSIVPPQREYSHAFSEYNAHAHSIVVNFAQREIYLQLLGGATATNNVDRSYEIFLPEPGVVWTLRENGRLLLPADSERIRVNDDGSIHYEPDIDVAVLNATFVVDVPREEIAEEERWWYDPAKTARRWAWQPTADGALGSFAQRRFAGINWATDANGAYLLDIAGWRQGGASLYRMEDVEAGLPETQNGTAAAQWQIDYTTQLLPGNEDRYAEFRGGAVSKTLGVALISVHDGAILPTNAEVMLSIPLEPVAQTALTRLGRRNVFRVTAFTDDGHKTYAKTPMSAAFSDDGSTLWGVSDGFPGLNRYEVLDGLVSSGQKLKLVETIPLTAAGETSQPARSMAHAVLGGRDVAFVLGTNLTVYAVDLENRAVSDTGVKAGSGHDQLAIAGVGAGAPHLYLARASITNVADTGNCLLRLYDVDAETLAVTPKANCSFEPETVADWCGFENVAFDNFYYTCAIAVPDNEKSLIFTWNFQNQYRDQVRYVVQKSAPALLSVRRGAGLTAVSVTSTDRPDDPVEVKSADQPANLNVRPYSRVEIGTYAVNGAAGGARLLRVGATLKSGDATRITETNGVWTVGAPGEIEVTAEDCADTPSTTAYDVRKAVVGSAAGALTSAQEAAIETNVNAMAAAVGGQAAAKWLERAGWGESVDAADVAAAKDADLAALLGTETLLATGVVATITAAAEVADGAGGRALAFTFTVEDGEGNGALALTAENLANVVKSFVRKSASVGEDAVWTAPDAEDVAVTVAPDKRSATVEVKLGGDDERGFYRLQLKENREWGIGNGE